MQEPAQSSTSLHDDHAWKDTYGNLPLLHTLVVASNRQEISDTIITKATEYPHTATPEEYTAPSDTLCPLCTAQTISKRVELVALHHNSPSEKIEFCSILADQNSTKKNLLLS